ncbi:hypothetical protein EIN_004480 [Entamoeba invadens IP1]|uniref:Uncharacterized protein n=1 Tax=Entamoeba invadens IP1 TaxID=370355 RepID=L7FML5_ENTIV|nr:hypothetical protein EIN_004480 [Entamoeba invadens IP1]ELP86391.1 hypothetical protein EIN_004480 [Entamoeba invadens IP1]|eukprot:XP_004185737.1 hypothetical protein EIN_004480 [Entamoeba invadens IP1]
MFLNISSLISDAAASAGFSIFSLFSDFSMAFHSSLVSATSGSFSGISPSSIIADILPATHLQASSSNSSSSIFSFVEKNLLLTPKLELPLLQWVSLLFAARRIAH